MTTSANRVFVILGVGFAAYLLMQAAYRNGTVSMFDWEWNKTAKQQDEAKEDDEAIARFGRAAGLDWDAINRVIFDDQGLFREGIRAGGTEETPGVIANLGGLSGKPYVIIDDEAYIMSGR